MSCHCLFITLPQHTLQDLLCHDTFYNDSFAMIYFARLTLPWHTLQGLLCQWHTFQGLLCHGTLCNAYFANGTHWNAYSRFAFITCFETVNTDSISFVIRSLAPALVRMQSGNEMRCAVLSSNLLYMCLSVRHIRPQQLVLTFTLLMETMPAVQTAFSFLPLEIEPGAVA